MSAADPSTFRSPRRRRDALLLSLGVLAAIVAALLPVFSVIEPGAWTAGALGVTVAVLGTGLVARLFSLPALVVSVLEAGVWILLLTAMFGRDSTLLGIIPTPATFGLVPDLVAAAAEEVRVGVAPVDAANGLSFVLVAAVGALAIVLDHVVLTARMPLLAGVGLVAVSLIPTIAVPAEVDVPGFVLLAAAILFLLRVETRSRTGGASGDGARTAARPRFAGASATAVGIAAVAVVVAIVATPLLPQPGLRFASGGSGGFGSTINPNLELGNDLRQPRPVDVLNVRTTAPRAPYLRAVTLSQFDGSVWEPDTGDTVQVPADGPVFDPVTVDADIPVVDWTTDVVVDELDSPWLPIPYPALQVSGLQGDWLGLPQNATVVTRSGSTRDQEYEISTRVPRPTLEQIRARPVGGDGLPDSVRSLPDGVPAVIEETARAVTAEAQSPYDALVDLQAWFRGTDFRYSLDAPVEDGFDGAGLDAVAQFLERREGYCVHFASAFAVMARTLDMPARIVVGYLPGTPTSGAQQGQTTYTVSSSQLHAWPEVFFEGIGWVQFEPTNSLGVPTYFAPGTTDAEGGAVTTPDQPDASAPQPAPTTAPQLSDEDAAPTGGTGAASAAEADATWAAWTAGSVVLLLLLAAPAVTRILRRRRRRARVLSGDALAAWTAIQERAIDLGIPAPAAESPRRYAARLRERHGADAAALDLLVDAVERASYAGEAVDADAGPRLGAAVDAVDRSLATAVSPARRLVAAVLPRSLVVRPGSAYAESRELISH
ncbi:transglutaminase TgpA family protein [Microbacterium sp. HMH0099]|uniref:transglutaminase TgpA family protein n=1 Tax=Microbacterium sp. HMH0099 TaxID=3414026 RepID=UPI003BF70C29